MPWRPPFPPRSMQHSVRPLALALALAIGGALVAGCGGATTSGPSAAGPTTRPTLVTPDRLLEESAMDNVEATDAQTTTDSTEAESDGRAGYPAHWWAPVPKEEGAWWEVLPQAAGPGEVVVSKRHELGLLSNFTLAPFEFRGQHYESVEGFWQMMKYPEGPDDPRALAAAPRPDHVEGVAWAHTRAEVAQMVAFEAKAAGDLASANMKAMGIDWVTFEGRRMPYWNAERGEHYALIRAAMEAKAAQNPEVMRVLLATGDLKLVPDHHQAPDSPPAWRYCGIWMEIRAAAQAGQSAAAGVE